MKNQLYENIICKISKIVNQAIVESHIDDMVIDNINTLNDMKDELTRIISVYGIDGILDTHNINIYYQDELITEIKNNHGAIVITTRSKYDIRKYDFNQLNIDDAETLYLDIKDFFSIETNEYPDFYEFDDFD